MFYYENLGKLDDDDIKFVTIHRRGKNIIERLNSLPKKQWTKVRVERAGNKKATIKMLDEIIFLKGYNKKIRQLSITGHGKIKPATILTNDFDLTMSILTHNLFRFFALDMPRYKHITDQTIYEKFLDNPGDIKINKDQITVQFKKKRSLPLILEKLETFSGIKYSWLKNLNINFLGATYS